MRSFCYLFFLCIIFLFTTAFAGTIYITTGTYSGDNNDDRSISGLGFQPDIVIVIGAGNSWYWKTNTMTAGDNSLPLALTSNYVSNYIQGLEEGGFQVGTALNASGSTYYYLAAKKQAGYINTGSYVGDGNDNRNISGIGFLPGIVMIQASDNSVGGVWRPSIFGGDSSLLVNGSFQTYDNEIQALQFDVFQIGTYGQVNTNTKTYHWMAIKDYASYITSGRYTGNNGSNRDINVGFTGTWVLVQNHNAGGSGGRTCATEDNASSGTAFTSINGAIGSELVDIVNNGFRVTNNSTQYLNANSAKVVYWYLKEGPITFSSRKNVVIVN
jgi:hypothetical protein